MGGEMSFPRGRHDRAAAASSKASKGKRPGPGGQCVERYDARTGASSSNRHPARSDRRRSSSTISTAAPSPTGACGSSRSSSLVTPSARASRPCRGHEAQEDMDTFIPLFQTTEMEKLLKEHQGSSDPDCAAQSQSAHKTLPFHLHTMHMRNAAMIRKLDVQGLRYGLDLGMRARLLHWLIDALFLLHLDDHILALSVQLLDRFASGVRRLEGEVMRGTYIACLVIAVKISQTIDSTWRQFVNRLSMRDFDLVIRREREVLKALSWDVHISTHVDFLDALCVRLTPHLYGDIFEPCPEQANEHPRFRQIAEFLCELGMLHAPFLYSYPSAVLAGSALFLALDRLGLPTDNVAYQILADDLHLTTRGDRSLRLQDEIFDCCMRYLGLWEDFNRAVENGDASKRQFQNKFSTRWKKATHVCVGVDAHFEGFPFGPICSAKGQPPASLDYFLALLTPVKTQNRPLPTPQSDLEPQKGTLLKRQTSSSTTRAGSVCSSNWGLKIVEADQCAP